MADTTPVTTLAADRLQAEVHTTRAAMGAAAAAAVAAQMRRLLSQSERIHVVFAAAPSQQEFLAALTVTPDLPWERVIAFHLDEYISLPAHAPQGFGNWLREHLFYRVPFAEVHFLNGNAADSAAECRRYGALLQAHPLHMACIGIGENGHIAFNDPPV